MNSHPRNSTLRMRKNDGTGKLLGDNCLGKIKGRGCWDFDIRQPKKESACVARQLALAELIETPAKPVIVDVVEKQVVKNAKADCFHMPNSKFRFGVLMIEGEKVFIEL